MRDHLGAGAAAVCDVPARLAHRAFVSSKKACDKWSDYEMHVAPYDPDGPIYYEFTACPTAEFARQFGLLEVMPALCSPDYAARAPHDVLKRLPLRLYDLRRPGRVVSGVPRIPRRGGVSAQYALTVDRWSDWLVLPPARALFPAREKYPKARQNQGFGILFGRQVGVSVGRGLNVVSASVLRRDDTTFKAPCKILQTCGTYYNNCPVCGTRLGYTPSCQPIPVHFVAANRDTSSKPPRFIRHWRRFGDFQKPWFLAAFFGYFLSLVKESNSPKAK